MDYDLINKLGFNKFASFPPGITRGLGILSVNSEDLYFFNSPSFYANPVMYWSPRISFGKSVQAKLQFDWIKGYLTNAASVNLDRAF